MCFAATGVEHDVVEVGTLTPGAERPATVLRAGEVGYMHGGIKSVGDARVGDTITLVRARNAPPGSTAKPSAAAALPGYKEPVRRA